MVNRRYFSNREARHVISQQNLRLPTGKEGDEDKEAVSASIAMEMCVTF